MNPADIGYVPPELRNQSALDLFLIFAGANIVATTLVTGASLYPSFGLLQALGLVLIGSALGAALVAALAPVGPKLGVPSMIAARAALGLRGASLLALLLYISNFAWIALNNVIAASACARILGGPGSERAWAAGLGLLATGVVARGPRAVGLADRVAVPLMLVVGVFMTLACFTVAPEVVLAAGTGALAWPRALDLVVGYQVSWILMFADYSRYTASPRHGALAVFLGLALTSAWYMPLGFVAARAAGSADPGAGVDALGLGAWGALLLALGTLTTNFVNLYLSALAWRSLRPGARQLPTLWTVGVIGTALSLLSRAWLDRYAEFMWVLGGLLVPVGGILLARFLPGRGPVTAMALYDPRGPYAGFNLAALIAWAAGALAYRELGGTLPALGVAMALALALDRRRSGAAVVQQA